jgi:uncharacterized alpha/beta hydrolase family protein
MPLKAISSTRNAAKANQTPTYKADHHPQESNETTSSYIPCIFLHGIL